MGCRRPCHHIQWRRHRSYLSDQFSVGYRFHFEQFRFKSHLCAWRTAPQEGFGFQTRSVDDHRPCIATEQGLAHCASFSPKSEISSELVISLEELRQIGLSELDKNPAIISERIQKIAYDDMATIIYTSGTTGTPKGVPLTHGNIVSVLDELKGVIPIDENDVYLSYLPMSHVFERVCGEYYWIYSGGVCAYAEGIETMAKNMAEVKPTMILTVPRVLDKIYGKVRSGIEGASGNARKLIDWSLAVGAEMVDAEARGITPRAGLKAKHWLAERTVFRKLRERISPSLRLIVSGGAPATGHTIEFFNAIGITTIEGYGLTETAAPACVNLMNRKKIGTVGPALPCVEMIIADDGEILMRGSSIFKGYYGLEEATKDAFVDGWFRTGDIGIVDGDGYLKITDRKKGHHRQFFGQKYCSAKDRSYSQDRAVRQSGCHIWRQAQTTCRAYRA